MKLELISHLPDTPTEKPPLLFLHGMGFGAWCWEEHFLPWFAKHGYPAYAMSLRGHGQSEGHNTLKWTALDSYVEDVGQIYDSFERKPVLIGHSMGGFIVQKFLAEHHFSDGKMPPAVILLASVPSTGMMGVAMRSLWRHPLASLKVLFTGSARPLLNTPEILQQTLLSKGVSKEKALKIVKQTGDESFRAFFTLMFVSSPKRRSNPPPMLVLAAENDDYIATYETENTARYYQADYKLIPDLAHLVMVDTHWERCAAELQDWLTKKGI